MLCTYFTAQSTVILLMVLELQQSTRSSRNLGVGTAKKLSQLPAVDMQHAPAKLPSKLHLSAYVDLLAQSLCSMHSHCTSKLG